MILGSTWAILDSIPDNPGLTIAVTLVNQFLSAAIYLPILLKRERRTDSQDAYTFAREFIERQSSEIDKLQKQYHECERQHTKTRRVYAKERRILQDQLTEMSDYVFRQTGHRFQSPALSEEIEEDSTPTTKKPPSKETDDALEQMPDDGDE